MNYLKSTILALALIMPAPKMGAMNDDVFINPDVQNVQQAITVTGVIVDAANEPLPGVNVVIRGTTTGTTTDIDGKYSINVPSSNAVLQFTYVGFLPQTITVGNQRTINVTMEEDALQIDEVVVVAYGTARKKELTGSVSTIDNKIIAQQQLSSVSRALEGAVAGVRTSSITGQPGSDAKIIIRGVGSVDGSVGTEALIVVDGVPMYNTTTWSLATANTSFSSINPNDIESITVSKDAASNALYGSRGANGVVFVTTKKGTSGKARVTLESRFGINQQGVPDMDMVKDPREYYEYAWKTIYNRYRYMGTTNADGSVALLDNTNKPNINNPGVSHETAAEMASRYLFSNNGAALAGAAGNGIGNYCPYRFPTDQYLVGTDGKLNPNAQLLYDNDWNKYFIKNRFRQEYNLDIQGGTERNTYYVSLGYLNDPSYIVRSEFERYSTRAAINSQVTSWLSTNFQMNYSHRSTEFQNNSDNPGSVNTNIFLFKDFFCPMWTLYAYDENGNIKKDPNTGEPLYDMGQGQTASQIGPTSRNNFAGYSPAVYVTKDRRFEGYDDLGIRGEAIATIYKDFRITVNMSMNNQYTKSVSYGNNVSGTAARDLQGSISDAHGVNMAITTQQLLTWNKNFDKHYVDAMVGHEFWWLRTENTGGSWRMMLIPYFQSSANATTYTGASSNFGRNATEGYFSRINYNYDQRYHLLASLRRDGTTKFDINKWGTFWSVGGAWRISEESFLSSVSQINDLKLRASYGTMGNANINNVSPTMTLWSVNNTGTVTSPVMGISQGAPANTELTWETNKQFDAGLEFRVLNRLYGSVDYFNRVTEDMIWYRPLPPSTGVNNRYENIGSLRNYGVEIELGAVIINRPDIRWSVDANISFLRNELLSIPPGVGLERYGGGFVENSYLRKVGKDWNNLYIYKYAGIDPETGLGLLQKELTQTDLDNDKSSGRNLWTSNKVGDIVATDNIDASNDWDDPTFFEVGPATPKAIGGFSTSLTYKNFDLSIICAYQIGGKYNSVNYRNLIGMNLGRGISKDNLNAWSPENKGSNLPMRFNGGTDNAGTPLAWFSASYFNLKTVTLGYNLPRSLMNQWKMNGIRIYAAVDNAYLKAAIKGLDPRYSLTGGPDVGAFSYPQARYLSLGFNMSF